MTSTTEGSLTSYLSNKQSQTNTDGRDESILTLLGGQHENRKDELARQEHFKEHALGNRHARGELCADDGDVAGNDA